MKTILVMCGVIVVVGGFLLWNALRLPDRFGTFIGAPTVEVAALIERPADFQHRTVAVEGVVRKQCTTMGCYFYFLSGDHSLRIDLAEIAMNAPRRNGHNARVEGQMVPYADGFQLWASAVEFH